MKRYILHITTFVACLLVSSSVWGQGTSGTWNATTLNADKTINLTGNITVKGTITIPNGKTLTINPNGNSRTIKADADINQIFYIENGGTLVIKGTETHPITIDGGATFSGGHPYDSSTYTKVSNTGFSLKEAIQSNNGTLTLSNVIIQNVYGDGNGGAILITGENSGESRPTSISNCVIRDCASRAGSAMHVNLGNGGGANANNCRVDVTDTTIEYCYAWGDEAGSEGGTIRSNGNCVPNINFKGVTVQYNYTTGCGGGVYWNGGGTSSTCFSFNGCTFDNNVALGQGGGMMLETTYTFTPNVPEGETVGVTTISNNKVLSENGTGGGIVVTSYGGGALNKEQDKRYEFNYDLTDKLSITNNSASEGGGIAFNFNTYKLNDDWINNDSPTYQVTANINLKGATISNNTAGKGVGGGIRLYNNTAGNNGNRKVYINVYLNSGTLSNNTAQTYGGGFYCYKANVQNRNVGKLTLSGNKAVSNDGGGIYIDGGTSINLASTEITNNSAVNGGAMAISSTSGNDLTISLGASKISGNNVTGNGGAIYLPSGNVTIANPEIKNNYSTNGGAVYLKGGSMTTTNSATVEGNYATDNGGAIYVEGGNIEMNNPNIKGNGKKGGAVITKQGGAIFAKGSFTTTGNVVIDNNASLNNGGAVYVMDGSVVLSSSTITSNNSNDGGAFYVTGGSITTADGTVSGNTATNEGGVFYVNNGSINLGAINVTQNNAKYGGAISLHNGTFTIDNACSIDNNDATELGGGLYVVNANGTPDIKFNGGKFTNNTAKSGGAVCASGSMNLILAATMQNNTATNGNGGAIYMVNGVKMTFGEGLIRANKALQPESNTNSYTTALKTNDVAGVGGGIFMASNSTLNFTSSKMGIYNNFATNAGADICSNGDNTSVTLPDITNMSLQGFEVPGNQLYWVQDYFEGESKPFNEKDGIRYEKALKDVTSNISELQISAGNYSQYLCLDLGYDLVFVQFKTTGLQEHDDAVITMSYPKAILDTSDKVTGYENVLYRKVLFIGPQTKTVGLPSGDWKFEATNWSYQYNDPTFDPGHITEKDQTTDKYINIKRGLINESSGSEIIIKFTPKENVGEPEVDTGGGGTHKKYVKQAKSRVVNRMGNLNNGN